MADCGADPESRDLAGPAASFPCSTGRAVSRRKAVSRRGPWAPTWGPERFAPTTARRARPRKRRSTAAFESRGRVMLIRPIELWGIYATRGPAWFEPFYLGSITGDMAFP